MSNYKTKINFKNKTVEIRAFSNNAVGGSKLFEFPVDERKDVIGQLQNIDRLLEYMSEYPDLAAIREIDSSMAAFLRKIQMAQKNLITSLSFRGAPDDEIENHAVAVDLLNTDIEMLLQLHAPESSLARGSVTTTAHVTPNTTGEAGTRATESGLPGVSD